MKRKKQTNKKNKKNKKVVDKPFQICYNKYVKKQKKQNTLKKVEVSVMAEKKITKREVINTMLADENVKGNEMYVAYLKNELVLLDKKAERKGKSADEVAQVNAIKSAIAVALESIDKGTVTEIQKANSELSEYSNQKLSALLRVMVSDGVVVKTTEKGKSIFSLV